MFIKGVKMHEQIIKEVRQSVKGVKNKLTLF